MTAVRQVVLAVLAGCAAGLIILGVLTPDRRKPFAGPFAGVYVGEETGQMLRNLGFPDTMRERSDTSVVWTYVRDGHTYRILISDHGDDMAMLTVVRKWVR